VSSRLNLADTTVLKSGNTFCVSLPGGRVPLEGDHPLGLYLDDCRYLSGHELRVDPAIDPQIERTVSEGGMVDRVVLRSPSPVDAHVELRLDADFRSIYELRGIVAPRARDVRTETRGDTLLFEAVGLDGRRRATAISCAGATASEDGRLRLGVRLEAGRPVELEVRFELSGVTRPAARAAPPDGVHVEVDDPVVERVLERSLLDMRMLTSTIDGRRYYAAGVPWYATLFGRDSIIAAFQMMAFEPEIAGETLRLLAARLGTEVDDQHDEEPGKVIHELRPGELADLDLTPLVRYYGTVDATPLFLCLLCEHADWSGSLDLFRELRGEVERALEWIDVHGDLDGDGLLEYRRRSPAGLENQGWKDSADGIVGEDGVLLRPPIALVEAQGYVVAAKRRLARLFELDGEPDRARDLRSGAARAADGLERFWIAERGFYAMALDGEKRPGRALASNQGHLLWARAVSPERAAAVRDALLSEHAHSGWGVRTLAASERAFDPLGYHTGTVWPHDNALLAVGFRSYGFDEAFRRIFEPLLEAATRFPEGRLPELFGGAAARGGADDPGAYPIACSPQAWAAGSVPYLLIAGLGLAPDALAGRLEIVRPSLPRTTRRLWLHGLRVAGARVDLVFERDADGAGHTGVVDVHVDGRLDVAVRSP
jgi:glycogen debranching enzyme